LHPVLRASPFVLAAAGLLAALTPRGAQSVPQYAARTGLPCQTCHFDPDGGGPRNEFGFAFAAHRHAVESEPEGSPWADLTLANRVSDAFPLYLGVNQRFMLLANKQTDEDSLERLGFFNMESNLHLAFQPHPRLTLVYSLDAFSSGPSNVVSGKEAFASIGGFPLNGFLKAGRFRTPFGLRMDDHTVATRNGFLDFGSQARFLPYDPRFPDMGIELGADHAGWYGRLALTNGSADVTFGGFAGAKTAKLGYVSPHYHGAVSFYDDYRKEGSLLKRATRWGYFGMAHAGPVAVVGEVAAGTDETDPGFAGIPGVATGPRTNLLAWFAELDVTPVRWLNTRARYDRLVTDRATDAAARDAATHSRYALEADWVPVPFAELRWVLRWIDHQDETAYGYRDETQSYLQLHLSY
jgi:hypothetical protein